MQAPLTYLPLSPFRSPPPIQSLPAIARDAVKEGQARLNMSAEMGLFCARAAMTMASQANVDVERPGGGTMPTSSFQIYAGTSGTSKSLPFRHFFGPARDIEREFEGAYDVAREESEIRLKLWAKAHRKALTALEKVRETGDKAGIECAQRLVDKSRKKRPVPPLSPRFMTSDASVAGLLRAQRQWPWIAVLSDEGGTILDSDLFQHQSHVNSLLDGTPAPRDRAHSSQHVPDGRVSFFIVTHPLTLDEFFKKTGRTAVDNGFLPRADLISPDPTVSNIGYRTIETLAPALPALDIFKARLRERLLLGIGEKMSRKFKRRALWLSPYARERWKQFAQDEIEANLRPQGKYAAFPAAASKSIEKVIREAASMHDFAANPEDWISDTEMEQAVLIQKWALEEWVRLMSPKPEEPEEIGYAREVLDTLQAHLSLGRPDFVQQSFVQPRVRDERASSPISASVWTSSRPMACCAANAIWARASRLFGCA